MRWILVLTSTVLIILAQGCKLPEASFTYSPESVAVGDTVFFQSTSHNAINFDWDFGDGSGSTGMHPIHIYQEQGTFSVSLRVYNQNGSDKSTETLTVSQ